MAPSAIEITIELDGGRGRLRPGKTLLLEADLGPLALRNPATAMLFTPGKAPFRLPYERVPSRREGAFLKANLTHLSPFVFLSPEADAWLRNVYEETTKRAGDVLAWTRTNALPQGIDKDPPNGCARELSTAAGKVGFPPASQGNWQRGRDSAVHPCLKAVAGSVSLEVTNNAFTYWAVKATPGVTFEARNENLDADLTVRVLETVLAAKGVKAHLSRQGVLLARLEAENPTALLQLRPDDGAFHAEELVVVLGLLVGLLGGDTGEISRLLDTASVVDCLRGLGDAASDGAIATRVTGLLDAATSVCGEKIAEGLGYRVALDRNAWNDTFAKKLAVFQAIGKAAGGLLGGVDAMRRKFSGPVTVAVATARPVACLTAAEFQRLGLYRPPPAATGFRVHQIECGGGYAAVRFGDSVASRNIYLLQRADDAWRLVYNNEGAEEGRPCDKVTPNVARLLGC
ncbi:hypothetical protein [Actinomadura hibisca]|uniref:hypothetical protein n=1 Tax=Actinomadura hibisca TaxID=68565 RepID=UPI0008368FDD|nr:hypothetical protein [Actinomadura hibisca]